MYPKCIPSGYLGPWGELTCFNTPHSPLFHQAHPKKKHGQPRSPIASMFIFKKDFSKGNKSTKVTVLPTETHFEVKNLQFGVAVHDPTQPYEDLIPVPLKLGSFPFSDIQQLTRSQVLYGCINPSNCDISQQTSVLTSFIICQVDEVMCDLMCCVLAAFEPSNLGITGKK